MRATFSFIIDLAGWLVPLTMESLRLGWLYDLLAPRTLASESGGIKRKLGAQDEGQESKRWRGDKVYLSVQDFLARMWGARDGNDNMTGQTSEVVQEDPGVIEGKDDSFWKQEPEINFAPQKLKVQFGDGTSIKTIKDIKNAKHYEDVVEGDQPEDFITDVEEGDGEPYEDPLSHSSFSQKKRFFMKEIKASEEAAAKGKSKWLIDLFMFTAMNFYLSY